MKIKKYIPLPVKLAYHKVKRSLKFGKYMMIFTLSPSDTMFYCPCCNMKVPSFIDGNFRNNSVLYNPQRYENTPQEVVCPLCGTIPRHRILALWLKKHINELKGDILYFAPEKGMMMWFKRQKIKVTTADLFAKTDLKLDLMSIDQPNESWDLIVCNHVLEHVDDYKKALSEIHRILKPNGTLIISFPILDNLPTVIEETDHSEENKAKRLKLYGQVDHLRLFGADSKQLLEKAGFSVSLINGNRMPKAILPIVGPADYDVNYLFVCRKMIWE